MHLKPQEWESRMSAYTVFQEPNIAIVLLKNLLPMMTRGNS
jgi:hypothetical protein